MKCDTSWLIRHGSIFILYVNILSFSEKLNVTFVDPARNNGVLSKDELQQVKDAQDKHRQLLRIPRRCVWSQN